MLSTSQLYQHHFCYTNYMPKSKKNTKKSLIKKSPKFSPKPSANLAHIWPYFFGVFISLAAGAIGSFFTMPFIDSWYAGLNKPFFNPPNWIFGPVWTLLYIMMGLAFGRIMSLSVTKGATFTRRIALELFIAQLILNSLWSIVFFGLQAPAMALLVIMALWTVLLLTIRSFAAVSKYAAYLLWPYLAWVSFATLLNAAIVWLN